MFEKTLWLKMNFRSIPPPKTEFGAPAGLNLNTAVTFSQFLRQCFWCIHLFCFFMNLILDRYDTCTWTRYVMVSWQRHYHWSTLTVVFSGGFRGGPTRPWSGPRAIHGFLGPRTLTPKKYFTSFFKINFISKQLLHIQQSTENFRPRAWKPNRDSYTQSYTRPS